MAGATHTQPATSGLTVVILTCDEELHIARAIDSVASLAQRIVVVDSGSADATRSIAAAQGADVFEREWLTYADQFQWALDNCAIETPWIMRLDADEWLGADLVRNLERILAANDPDVAGLSFDRRHHFLGRWIRHGGRYPLRLLRVWRKGQGRIEQRWMDEHMLVDGGRIEHVPGTFVDENLRGLEWFTTKHARYATREAIDVMVAKYALFDSHDEGAAQSTAQAMRVRKGKTVLYNRLPLGVGPLLYFLYRYLLRLGVLDGRAGLIYHGLQGLWYRFLVDARRYEFERAMAGCSDAESRIACLSEQSGYDLRRFYRLSDHRDG